MGWAQAWHHQLRQLRLRYADGVPVHHHGGLDRCPVLGMQMGHLEGGYVEGLRPAMTSHLPTLSLSHMHPQAEGWWMKVFDLFQYFLE